MKNLLKVSVLFSIIFTYAFSTADTDQLTKDNGLEFVQDKQTVVGVYEGFDSDYYYFRLANGKKFGFNFLKQGVRKIFNFEDKSLLGKKYEITYDSEIEDQNEESQKDMKSEVHTITDLKPIQ